MGYTLYWKYAQIPTKQAIQKILSEIPTILQISPHIELTGDPEGELKIPPVFTDKEIIFNGLGKDSHETFYMDLTEPTDFCFCKTARKPYDLPASLILISFKNHMQGFKYSSDEEY